MNMTPTRNMLLPAPPVRLNGPHRVVSDSETRHRLLTTLREMRDDYEQRAPKPGTRAREVLDLMCSGMSPEDVARSLGVARSTVHSHTGYVREKMNTTMRELRVMHQQQRAIKAKIAMYEAYELLETGFVRQAMERLEEGVLE